MHFLFTEELAEVQNQAVDFVTDVGQVQRFKLTEDLVAEDVVKTVEQSADAAAAAAVGRNELFELLHALISMVPRREISLSCSTPRMR